MKTRSGRRAGREVQDMVEEKQEMVKASRLSSKGGGDAGAR